MPSRLNNTIHIHKEALSFMLHVARRKSALSFLMYWRAINPKAILIKPAAIAPNSLATTIFHTVSVSRPAIRNGIQTYESSQSGNPTITKLNAAIESFRPKFCDSETSISWNLFNSALVPGEKFIILWTKSCRNCHVQRRICSDSSEYTINLPTKKPENLSYIS